MNPYREVYRRICTEIEILDDKTFRHPTLGRLRLTREIDVEQGALVLSHLWRFLYLYYYAADLAAAAVLMNGSRTVISIADREDTAFVAGLSAAHPSRCYAEPGWTVLTTTVPEFLVQRDGLSLTVTRDEVAAGRVPPRAGDIVSVRFPAERRYSNPGWYVAIGEAGLRRADQPTVRLYYSLGDPAQAPQFLRASGTLLNSRRIPFHTKVVNDPAGFSRNDPIVTYLALADWRAHRPALQRLYGLYRDSMRDVRPCFARHLDHGWSLAAEPVDAVKKGVSFGQQRCILVAEGLLRAWAAGAFTVPEREQAVLQRLREAGIDPDRPYLNPEPAS